MIKLFRRLLWLLVFLGLFSRVHAHALDEYVHATLVEIQPGEIRFEINLTPGVAVVDQVLRLIDTDRDGVISTNESVAYAELLKRDLSVRLDDQNVELKLTALTFPKMADLRTGWGIIQMEFSATPKALAAGSHTARHRRSASTDRQRLSHQRLAIDVRLSADHRTKTKRKPEHGRNRL